jgi:hypothetical protein
MVVHFITVWYIVIVMNSGRGYAAHMRNSSAYKDLDRKPERERETYVQL